MADTPLAPLKGGIAIVRYSEEYRAQWEEFVAQSNQGTLFHTRAFLAYHPPARFDDESLLFFKEEKLLAVLPAARRTQDNARVLHSHPGASFGGFVAQEDLSLSFAEQIVAAFLAYCESNGHTRAQLTLTPHLYSARPNQHFEYLLYRRGFRYAKREMTSMIAPESALDSWPREARRDARRAEKRGVTIRESEEWGNFFALLERHMWQRHQVRPTHTLEELLRLRALCPERLRLFAAYIGAEMIAGMLLFLCNTRVALAFYYVSWREGFQHYHGFHALFAEVLQWCARQDFRYLDFGTYTLDSQPNFGLADFKESFGGQGFLRDTMVGDFDASRNDSERGDPEK